MRGGGVRGWEGVWERGKRRDREKSGEREGSEGGNGKGHRGLVLMYASLAEMCMFFMVCIILRGISLSCIIVLMSLAHFCVCSLRAFGVSVSVQGVLRRTFNLLSTSVRPLVIKA